MKYFTRFMGILLITGFAVLSLMSCDSLPAFQNPFTNMYADEKAAAANSETQEYVYSGGTAYYQGSYDNAIANFSEAIKLTPNHPLPYYFRAMSYQNIKNYDAAIADYSQAIQFNSDLPIPPYAYTEDAFNSNIYYITQIGTDYGTLERDLPLNTIHLQNSEMLRNRGSAYELKGLYDQAIADYTEALRLDPSKTAYQADLERVRAKL